MRIKKFSLNPMNILKSYFPPGSPRNIWHLLLLISALFATVFNVVGVVVLAFSVKGDLTDLLFFPGLAVLGVVGFALLAIFCLRKASGIVRYWASFLWLGLFLLFVGIVVAPASYSIAYQLFYLLGSILLLVFFWNLGNLDRRILAPLFLLFTPLCGILFISEPGWSWSIAEVGFMVGFTVGFIICFVFYSLFAIMAVNSNKLLKLPGFRWLFAGFSFFLLVCVAAPLVDSYLENYGDLLAPLVLILILISPVLLIVGAALFTLKMDPAQLEERLRKASPAKEVESVN